MTTAPSNSPNAGAPDERPPLTRERVLATAIALADEHGVDGLSMRKLAAQLGYEVMSLYNHVRNKDDLLEAMLDEVYGTIAPPAADDDWKPALRSLAVRTHDALLAHRWAAPLIPTTFPGPNRFGVMEWVLDLLRRSGFDDHVRDLGFHAVTLHIAGFTQQQLSYASVGERMNEAMDRFAREVTPDRFPLMVDHAAYHTERDRDPGDRPDEFEFVLDLILDGLERLRPAG